MYQTLFSRVLQQCTSQERSSKGVYYINELTAETQIYSSYISSVDYNEVQVYSYYSRRSYVGGLI